jgi:hypothetical protein
MCNYILFVKKHLYNEFFVMCDTRELKTIKWYYNIMYKWQINQTARENQDTINLNGMIWV